MNLAQTLMNIGRGLVHAPAEFATGLAYTPKAVYRLAQNKPIDDIQRRVFGTNDSGTIAKKIIGDTGQLGLMALGGPAYKASMAAPTLARQSLLGAGSGSLLGGAMDMTSRLGQGQNPTLQGTAQGALLGGLVGGASPLMRAMYLRGRTPSFEVNNGMDATFAPKQEFQIKAGVPLQNNPLKKGFEIVDNNPQPFKIVDNSVPRQATGWARQAQMGAEPLDDITMSALERAQVKSYFRSKPTVKGSALSGEGARLPKNLSPTERARLIRQMRKK